jgi:hypothetical protein
MSKVVSIKGVPMPDAKPKTIEEKLAESFFFMEQGFFELRHVAQEKPELLRSLMVEGYSVPAICRLMRRHIDYIELAATIRR